MSRPENYGKEWSESDLERLRGLYHSNSNIKDIAIALGRDEGGVLHKLRRLGLITEEEFFKINYRRCYQIKPIVKEKDENMISKEGTKEAPKDEEKFPENHGKAWTCIDHQRLLDKFHAGESLGFLVRLLKRNKYDILIKLNDHHIISKEDLAHLLDLGLGGSIKDIKKAPEFKESDFPDMDKFFELTSGEFDFDDFMQHLYEDNSGWQTLEFAHFKLKILSNIERNGYGCSMDNTYSGTIELTKQYGVYDFNFEVRDGDSSGTEVQNFDLEVSSVKGSSVLESKSYVDKVIGGKRLLGFWKVDIDKKNLYISNEVVHTTNEENNTTTFLNNNTGVNNMNRRTITLQLWDNDKGLEDDDSLVGHYEDIITGDTDEEAIQTLLMDSEVNVSKSIAEHNAMREKTVNLDVLNRTGNEVKLRSIKLKDLTWVVKP